MQKKDFDVSYVLLAVIAAIALCAIIFTALCAMQRIAFIALPGGAGSVTVTLVVFEDAEKPPEFFVVLYHPVTRRAAIFNVPGDTGRIIKTTDRVDRIDTVYDGARPGPFIDELKRLLGTDIHNTMIFNIDGVSRIVDLLDGVRVQIPAPIEIYNGRESVLLPSGRVLLDGDKVVAYLRYEDEGETSVLHRQRFFFGLLSRLNERRDYIGRREIGREIAMNIRGAKSTRARTDILRDWGNIDTDRLAVQSIGGDYREVSEKRLLIPHYDGALIKDIIRQSVNALARNSGESASDRIITVEVLNGTGVSGLAGRTADMIRGFGYDVINIANADRDNYDTTTIFYHAGLDGDAENFAGLVHCDNLIEQTPGADTQSEIDEYEHSADFTLILGRDYNGRFN